MAVSLPGNPGIDNTAFLFFVLVAAFAFFVTVRGDLPKWLGLFGLAGSSSSSSSATSPSSSVPSIGDATGANGLPALPAVPKIGQ